MKETNQGNGKRGTERDLVLLSAWFSPFSVAVRSTQGWEHYKDAYLDSGFRKLGRLKSKEPRPTQLLLPTTHCSTPKGK